MSVLNDENKDKTSFFYFYLGRGENYMPDIQKRIKSQKFGVEIEMTVLTRAKAALRREINVASNDEIEEYDDFRRKKMRIMI